MVIISLLIIVGLILILAEILLIPGIFLTGILGLGSLAYSCYLGFSFYGTWGGIITIAVNSLLLLGCIIFALRSDTWKKLALNAKIDSHTDNKPEEKGFKPGQEGITITRLNPMGKIKIGSEFIEASTLEGLIDENTPVVISEIIDNKIFVKIK